MRCKKHPADLSCRVGVCASCLRERLSAIIAAQVLKQAQQECLKSDFQKPPPLPFPRSVSPYISRRKSDTAAAGRHQRFFSTPHVGPTGSITVELKSLSTGKRFSSLISGLFRSKSDRPVLSTGPIPDPGASANPSWFSTIIRGGRKKKIRNFSIDETTTTSGTRPRNCGNRDRGMSPERYPGDDDEHCHGGSSGYSSESSQGWKQTPRRTPASTRRGGTRAAAAHGNNISAFAFCLSPLVRGTSPNRHWSQKGAPPEMAIGGEFRAPPKPQLSTAASFCKNRSRKLADFGRYNYDPPTH